MKIFFTTTNVLRSILRGKTERYRTERLRSGVKKLPTCNIYSFDVLVDADW